MGMKVLKINVTPFKSNTKTIAMASATLGDESGEKLRINGIKVINGAKGLFVGMPSTKRNDKWEDLFYFVDKDSRESFNAAVLEAYEVKKNGGGEPRRTTRPVNSDELPEEYEVDGEDVW